MQKTAPPPEDARRRRTQREQGKRNRIKLSGREPVKEKYLSLHHINSIILFSSVFEFGELLHVPDTRGEPGRTIFWTSFARFFSLSLFTQSQFPTILQAPAFSHRHHKTKPTKTAFRDVFIMCRSFENTKFHIKINFDAARLHERKEKGVGEKTSSARRQFIFLLLDFSFVTVGCWLILLFFSSRIFLRNFVVYTFSSYLRRDRESAKNRIKVFCVNNNSIWMCMRGEKTKKKKKLYGQIEFRCRCECSNVHKKSKAGNWFFIDFGVFLSFCFPCSILLLQASSRIERKKLYKNWEDQWISVLWLLF